MTDSRPATILVADDDPAIRALFRRGLERVGLAVVEATSGSEALALLETTPVALVLLDVTMPGLTGYEVVEAIRSRAETATLPVIMVTGSGDDSSMIRGLEAGADDFLSKPVRLDELTARVRARLRSQTAWGAAIEGELRSRSSLVSALSRLSLQGDPEALARAVLETIGARTDIRYGAILATSVGDRIETLATLDPDGSVGGRGTPLHGAESQSLMARAEMGPWVQPVRPPTPDSVEPSSPLRLPDGVDVAAMAPIHAGDRVVGFFVLGATSGGPRPSGPSEARLLAAAIDYAGIVGAVAGTAFLDRRVEQAAHGRLTRILSQRAFHPVFQPIVSLKERGVVGYEALTRFDDGTRPDLRFAEATAHGLGLDFELAAVELALAASRRLPGTGFISLNVSPGTVLERERLRALLLRASRPVVLELTEHTPIADYPALRGAVASLGEVTIAVDDAGAGYASLRHILELRPAHAKLDISIVRGIEADTVRQALVAGLQYYATRGSCTLIAEGVETEAEARALTELGVELAQGYLFGRPAPVDAD